MMHSETIAILHDVLHLLGMGAGQVVHFEFDNDTTSRHCW